LIEGVTPMNRRAFITHSLAATAVLGTGVLVSAQSIPPAAAAPEPGKIIPPSKIVKPPAFAAEKVQAVVGQSHRSLDEVKKLVAADPLLVNASWDWGGGDFETPLQAAAHTGRREIAEYLLSQNARPDLFAAAMLGQLDFLKAALAAQPSLLNVHGPHGFTLLHCAKQGGAGGRPVYDYLLAAGGPEIFQRPLPFKFPPVTSG
jgi:hypothetical protein